MAANYKNPQDAQTLGDRLRSTRKNAGMTISQLALHAKVSHSQISRIERGLFKGPSKNVQILCKKMKIDWKGRYSAMSPLLLAQRLERMASLSPKWTEAIISFVEAVEAAQSGEIHRDGRSEKRRRSKGFQ